MRNGAAIAAASGSACCCGTTGPTDCVPSISDCGCAAGCITAPAFRSLVRLPACGGSEIVVYQVPISCCCSSANPFVPWYYSFRRTVVQNGCTLETMTGSGFGNPTGTINWTKDCKLDAVNCGDSFNQTGSNGSVNMLCGPPDGFFPTTPCWAGPFGACVSRTGYIYRDCNTYELQSVVIERTDPPNSKTTIVVVHIKIITGDGACQVANPSCGACCCLGVCFGHMTPAACAAMGGVFKGAGSACTPTTCPPQTGKCCHTDGTCDVRTRSKCDDIGGIYMGDGTTCQTRPGCPPPQPPPVRACCLPDHTCREETLDGCNKLGGAWSPTQHCGEVDCGTLGACCYPDGSCSQSTADVCAGNQGVWHPAQACSEVTCPTGACCVISGAGANCVQLSGADCLSAGGIFQGVGVPCTNDPFQCQGACCQPNPSCPPGTTGFCADLNGEVFCNNNGGIYKGNGTVCGVDVPTNFGCCVDQARGGGSEDFI